MSRFRLRIAALACAVIALPAVARAESKVAILGLEVVDQGNGAVDSKSSAFARALTRELRGEAGKEGGGLELAPGSAKELLELKLLSDCSDEGRRCMAEIGKELKADLLMYGKVEKQRDGYQVSLKLLDTATAKTIKSTTDLVPFSETRGAALNTWGGTMYGRLTGAPELGTLVLHANVDTGKVYVDGELSGELVGGAAKVGGLSEGVHRVTVLDDGKARYDQEVTITSGQSSELAVTLENEESIPAVEEDEDEGRTGWRKAFWVTTGVTVVGTGLWVYELYQYSGVLGLTGDGPIKSKQLTAASAARDLIEDPMTDLRFSDKSNACEDAKAVEDDEGALGDAAQRVSTYCSKGNRAAKLTLFFGIATGLSAVAAAYFYYRGHRAEPAAERSARRKTPRKPVVTLTPAIGPRSLGAGLAIEF